MRKKFDAVVKTGSYTTPSGETKARYENVGTVMENEKGELSLLLKATFNPAGVQRDPGRDNIFVSFYTPKDRQPTAHDTAKQDGYQPETNEAPF